MGVCSYLTLNNIEDETVVIIKKKYSEDDLSYLKRILIGSNFIHAVSVSALSDCFDNEYFVRDKILIVTPDKRPVALVSFLLKKRIFNFNIVNTEEGIGSYGGYLQDVRAFCRQKLKARPVVGILLGILLFFLFAAFDFMVCRRKKYHLLFDRDLFVSDRVRLSIKNHLRSYGNLLGAEKYELQGAPFILYLTAPYVELGLMSPVEEKNILDIIQEREKPRKVLVKQHPYELKGKYDDKVVIDTEAPAEILVLFNRDRFSKVYCFSSTFLYSGPLLLGVNAVRIDEFDELFFILSKRQKRILEGKWKFG